MGFLVQFVINALALAFTAWLLPGITIGGGDTSRRVLTLVFVSALFGLVNAVVKPITKLLAFPLILLTLGLMLFVIDALMLLLVSWISGQLNVAFHVDTFWTALLGGLILAVVSMLLRAVLPSGRRR